MATVRHLILHLQDLIRSLTFPIWKTTGKNKHKGNKATGSLAFDFPQCTVVFLQFAIIVGYVKGQSLEQEHLINTWFISPPVSSKVSFPYHLLTSLLFLHAYQFAFKEAVQMKHKLPGNLSQCQHGGPVERQLCANNVQTHK